MSTWREIAIGMIRDERDRQDKKWGTQRKQPDTIWLAILVEEVGEAAEAILEGPGDMRDLETELVQVAAVATAWIEAIQEEAFG